MANNRIAETHTDHYGVPYYGTALELYRTTTMTVKEICRQTSTPLSGFRSYLRRCHRDLMFARHGIVISPEEASKARLRKPRGQTAAAHAKYKDAITACDDIGYIEFNVSQIARIFGLNPTALSNQLRNHYPEILDRREKERHRLGVNDNLHRGMKRWCKEQYAEAVAHLCTTDDTIRQTADIYHLSYTGLREHLLYYHKELILKRAEKRQHATSNKIRGALTGNGMRHEPKPEILAKYSNAVELYRTTAMTQKEICARTGVTPTGIRNHLRIWHKELVREHHDVDCRREIGTTYEPKRYLKSTAAKYASAIKQLKASNQSTAEVAKDFGLNPEIFREYLHEHQPELAASLGMTKLENGRLVLARSAAKYEAAVQLYATTTEPLKSIARRLGVQYNSIGAFIRRNRPDAIELHNRLLHDELQRLEKETDLKHKKEQAQAADILMRKESEERNRILQALKQTGGNKRNAAKLLGMSRATLYNKFNLLNLNQDLQAGTPPQYAQP